MKDLPLIFPLSLLVIVLLSVFTGAYAIAENALDTQTTAAGTVVQEADIQWFEKGSIWLCPLH